MRRIPLAAMLMLLALFSIENRCLAQAFVEHVFPPCVARGRVTRIELVGSHLQTAHALWTTLPGDKLKTTPAGESRSGHPLFDVELANEAPLGLYGLRVATDDGLSNVHLFAVDDLPIVTERESLEQSAVNNGTLTAQQVDLPAAVVGTSREADIDVFAIDVLAGQRVTFEVLGSRLGKGFDPVVTILDADGRFVLQRDNSVGLFFDCRFDHIFEKAGRYFVKLQDSRYHGTDHWTYVLRMGRFPVAHVVLPSSVRPGQKVAMRFPQIGSEVKEFSVPQGFSQKHAYYELRSEGDDGSVWLPISLTDRENRLETEPNQTPEQATSVSLPANLHGTIGRAGDRDNFAFDLHKGEKFVFRTETRRIGSPADLELALIDPQGKVIQRGDDFGFEDATFSWTVPKQGRYSLQVSEVVDKGGPEYAYRIEVSRQTPGIRLISEAGRLAIPRGSRQPLPLLLERTNFGGPVELTLLGAPAGMSLRTTTIEKGTNALTGTLLVDNSISVGLYSLQIVGRASTGKIELETLARTQPLIDRKPTGRGPHGEAFELREDQRRLPPSVTDRIAILVTPESPFDFELAEPLVTLPRYSEATLPIQTTFVPGFDQPVAFVARGGSLERVRLRNPTVTTEIPIATAQRPAVTARFRSGVNSQLVRHRVTITGTTIKEGRAIHLTRTFDLQLKVAFNPQAKPNRLELEPGASATVRITARRLAQFDGAVTISPVGPAEISVPRTVSIPGGQSYVDVDVSVAATAKPGRYTVRLPASARVANFSEQIGGEKLEVIVKAKVAESSSRPE